MKQIDTQSKDMSWGELTDEIRHDGIGASQDLWRKIQLTAHHTSNKDAFKGKDFYLVVLHRRNRSTNQPESLVWPRISCPTPVYNQHVFKYRHNDQGIEYLWSLPTRDKYYYYLRHGKELMSDPVHAQQVEFCLLMESGQLLEWVKKENKEDSDGPQLVLRPKTVLELEGV